MTLLKAFNESAVLTCLGSRFHKRDLTLQLHPPLCQPIPCQQSPYVPVPTGILYWWSARSLSVAFSSVLPMTLSWVPGPSSNEQIVDCESVINHSVLLINIEEDSLQGLFNSHQICSLWGKMVPKLCILQSLPLQVCKQHHQLHHSMFCPPLIRLYNIVPYVNSWTSRRARKKYVC